MRAMQSTTLLCIARFFMACTHTTYGPKPATRDYIG